MFASLSDLKSINHKWSCAEIVHSWTVLDLFVDALYTMANQCAQLKGINIFILINKFCIINLFFKLSQNVLTWFYELLIMHKCQHNCHAITCAGNEKFCTYFKINLYLIAVRYFALFSFYKLNLNMHFNNYFSQFWIIVNLNIFINGYLIFYLNSIVFLKDFLFIIIIC